MGNNGVHGDQATVQLPLGFIAALSDAGSVQQILNTTAQWLPSIVRAERASVALRTGDGAGLEVFAMGGNEAIAVGAVLPIEGSLVGRVFRERRTINFTDHSGSDAPDAKMLVQAGLMTCLDAPLLSAGECFGTVNLGHSEIGFFDVEAERVLTSLGWLLGSSIRIHRQAMKMEELANTDPLTGILNRRAFNRAGGKAWREYVDRKRDFAVVLLDLDDFKSINDNNGHGVGDAVLCSVATNLRQTVRGSDVVARVGGEEFAIILPDVSPEAGRSWAEQLRNRIERSMVPTDDSHVRYTASIGVSISDSCDRSFESVFARADRALYGAKEKGRNQVILANGC